MLSSFFLIQTVVIGCIYTMIGMVLCLIKKTTKFIYRGAGGQILLSGYLIRYFSQSIDLYWSLFFGITIATLLGSLFVYYLTRLVEKKDLGSGSLMLIGIAYMLFIQSGIQAIFGTSLRTVSLDITIQNEIIVIILSLSLILGIGILFFIKKVRIIFRMISENVALSYFYGVSVRLRQVGIILFSNFILGVTGFCLLLLWGVTPSIVEMYFFKGYIVSFFALFNPYIVVLYSFFMSYSENTIGLLWQQQGKDLVIYIFFFVCIFLSHYKSYLKNAFTVHSKKIYDTLRKKIKIR